MAYRMKLNSAYQGMTHIWNISGDVGVLGSCRNSADDVELVQRLLIERYKVRPSKTPRAAGIGMQLSPSGRMDLGTAFEVYWSGDGRKPLSDAEKISPARAGALSYGSGFWTIGYLNYALFVVAPQVWASLPELCSPALKNALLMKTTA